MGTWGCGDVGMWGHGDVGAGMAPPALTLLLPMAAQSPFPPPFFPSFLPLAPQHGGSASCNQEQQHVVALFMKRWQLRS